MKVFQKLRLYDINLELAVSERKQILTYYMFNKAVLNGFSTTISIERQTEEYKIVDTIAVSSLPLYQILNEHLAFEQTIDFLLGCFLWAI